MKKYYCTVSFDDTPGIFECDVVNAIDEEQALENFKGWFYACYGHLPNFKNGVFEAKEISNSK